MDGWLSALLIFLGISLIIMGAFQIWILLQYRSNRNTSSTTAKLVKTKCTKNAQIRDRGKYRTKTVAHWTDYTYIYTVNGKDYTIKSGIDRAPGKLPKMPRVVYLTKFPHHGYIPEMIYMKEPIVALLAMLASLACYMLSTGC